MSFLFVIGTLSSDVVFSTLGGAEVRVVDGMTALSFFWLAGALPPCSPVLLVGKVIRDGVSLVHMLVQWRYLLLHWMMK